MSEKAPDWENVSDVAPDTTAWTVEFPGTGGFSQPVFVATALPDESNNVSRGCARKPATPYEASCGPTPRMSRISVPVPAT